MKKLIKFIGIAFAFAMVLAACKHEADWASDVTIDVEKVELSDGTWTREAYSKFDDGVYVQSIQEWTVSEGGTKFLCTSFVQKSDRGENSNFTAGESLLETVTKAGLYLDKAWGKPTDKYYTMIKTNSNKTKFVVNTKTTYGHFDENDEYVTDGDMEQEVKYTKK